MATILFTWELGAGLGHMLPMLPLVEALVARGHRVFVALRQLAGAAAVFGRCGASLLQAPTRYGLPGPYPHTPSLAHILANIGWGDDGELLAFAGAWRNLIRLVDPDLIGCDHSPTALLAARCFPDVPKVVMGLGFFCPPDVCPLPRLVRAPVDPEQLAADEARVLERVNRLLSGWGEGPLDRLGQLYREVDETFLMTFRELDHYPDRPAGTRYWGAVISGGGKAPQWPQSRTGRRVYAYLKNFPALPEVLKALAERGDATLVFADGVDAATRRKFTSPTVRFETERLDLTRVGAECDVAVHNANHGTLARLLLSGRPMLNLPLTLEQTVLARAVDRTGAAETARVRGPDVGDEVRQKLDALLASDRYAAAARAFAERHADFDPAAQVQRMVDRVEELLDSPNRRAGAPIPAGKTRVPAGVFRA